MKINYIIKNQQFIILKYFKTYSNNLEQKKW